MGGLNYPGNDHFDAQNMHGQKMDVPGPRYGLSDADEINSDLLV